jgi:glucose-6-phosphate 1-dehydrogenase
LFYLSVGPDLYPQIVTRMGEAGLNKEDRGFRRLIVEKPFGRDERSAVELNRVLLTHFNESQIYRIDHYMGKETVQNIMVFRFANTLFEPLWNREYIDHVQITVAESVTVGKRAGYYDTSGVLRDMFQNHLLQVMTLVALDPPLRYTADTLRDAKLAVMKSIRVPTADEACQSVVLGQYAGYKQEKGVAPNSRTPTFAAVRFEIDNDRWRDIPFYLRSGKGMASRVSEVVIQFRCPPGLMFPMPPGESLSCNRLTIRVQPDEGIRLNFTVKAPGTSNIRLHAADLAFDYAQEFGKNAIPEAYERLLLDAMNGDASLFIRGDLIERAWQIVDPLIRAAEADGDPNPQEYEKGSWGPECAERMLAAEGRVWKNAN